MGLLRFLAIFLLIYLGMRFIGRLIFPPDNHRYKHFERNDDERRSKKEGEVTIDDQRSANSKKIKRDEGEYIDYEEVDE